MCIIPGEELAVLRCRWRYGLELARPEHRRLHRPFSNDAWVAEDIVLLLRLKLELRRRTVGRVVQVHDDDVAGEHVSVHQSVRFVHGQEMHNGILSIVRNPVRSTGAETEPMIGTGCLDWR
ncbi:hypothetical protein MLD38_040247 [Melastoma candidum]|uniref:Uncharacterized protein n=1 Tax=Melastoma candidum TaxID=119954 RepID=A0ACB9L5U3_9MYRT|nr:hypothetical protein MLD38_040247 [Melastoma candidum]